MLTQSERPGKLTTPLGQDKLCLVEMTGEEALSELFEFCVIAVSDDANVDMDALIGQPAHVELDSGAIGRRFFHGRIVEAHWERAEFDLFYYRLVLRPWFWLLGKTTDCRIHHDKTVVDIIRETLSRRGFSDFRVATTQSYPSLHYTVQYRETDLNFLCRLMEQHGIYYFFEHSADRHTLVLADSPSSHNTAPGLTEVKFNPHLEDGLKLREPILFTWLQRRGLRSGKVQLTDYNHLKPNARMIADANGSERHRHSDLEVFDYPGPYVEQPDGERYARVRLEAEQAAGKRRVAKGVAVALFPGAKVDLTRYPRASENDSYLAVRVNSRFGPQSYRSEGAGATEEASYQADYEFQTLNVPFRAPFATEKPLIHSLQTAIVTGQKGEEIDCDDHGRILVHFYWDRHDDKSCRLRVSQVWGSQSWGAQVIPRIGMEVMIAYIEGDPDRPIVVGTVPNPQTNRVPYDLPVNKTRMVWRSNTYKGTGFNELSFEDKPNGENFLVHAQKDFTQKVLNNQTARIDNSSATSVGRHASTEIGGNSSQEIGGSQNNVVGAMGPAVMAAMAPVMGLMSQTAGLAGEASRLAGGLGGLGPMAMGVVGQAASALLGASAGGAQGRPGVVSGGSTRPDMGTALAGAGTQLLQGVGQLFGGVPGLQNNFVTAAKTDVVGALRSETVGQTKVTNVGATFFTKVGKAWRLSVGEAAETQVGKTKVIDVGETFEITAGQKFSIKVGETRLQMDKTGVVTIEGATTTIVKGGGAQLTVGPGPILYVPNLVPGSSPTPPASCLKRMSAGGVPFVGG